MPRNLGAPTGFTLHVKGMSLRNGAGFVVVSTGHILDMPGLPKHPAALDIDVDDNRQDQRPVLEKRIMQSSRIS
jgi:formyltetrahydrofolate synthetase